MSGVQPTLIDYQGITMNNSTLERSVTLTMDGTSQGLILQYDKLTANQKQFSITNNGINYTDNTNNNTTGLQRLAQVQQAFQAIELPPDSTTLQVNNRVLLKDPALSVSGNIFIDGTGNLKIDASNNIYLSPLGGTIFAPGKTINIETGIISKCAEISGPNNTNIELIAIGSGDVLLRTGGITRLTITDAGAWTVNGGMLYNNATNTLTAGTFAGAVAAGQLAVTDDNTNNIRYPIFASGTGNADIYIDSGTGPLTYNPSSGIMSFPSPPTCSTAATTTNQLVNFNNFTEISFIPTVRGSTTAGSPTYVTQTGTYVRINNFCCFQAEIQISDIGGMAGGVQLSLPFTSTGITTGALSIGVMDGLNSGTAMVDLMVQVPISISFAQALYRATSTSPDTSVIGIAQITNNFKVRYGGSYICV